MRRKTIHRTLLRKHLYPSQLIHKIHSFSLGKLWITFCSEMCPPRLFPSGLSPKHALISEKSLWISLCTNNYI